MKKIALIISALSIITFTNCKKDPAEPSNNNNNNNSNTATTVKLILTFEAMFGDSALVLNNKTYVTANGDSVKISTFKYYISNITLTKTDNSTYTVPESYYLVNHNSSSTGILLSVKDTVLELL
jgi:hypothetical protein